VPADSRFRRAGVHHSMPELGSRGAGKSLILQAKGFKRLLSSSSRSRRTLWHGRRADELIELHLDRLRVRFWVF